MSTARALGLCVGLCLSFAAGLACAPKDGSGKTVARRTRAQSPVVAKCLEGCERIRSCEEEIEVDPAALARCDADCRRVETTGADSTQILDRCLERPTCMGLADCIRGKPTRTGPLVAPDTGARGCEPLCGQVGDCLVGLGSETPVAAARVETSCLDVCLDKTAETGLDSPMLACGDERYCSDLVGCVSEAWAPRKTSEEKPQAVQAGDQDDCSALCDFLTRCDPNASITGDECKMMCGPIVSMFKPGSIPGCVGLQGCEAATECLGQAAAEAASPPKANPSAP